jgi:hypothetical protein
VTLIELAVTVAILAVILLCVSAFTQSLSSAVDVDEQVTEVNHHAGRALSDITEALYQAFVPSASPATWVTPLYAGANTIQFLVPVDYDGDGDVFGANMAEEWGAIRPDYTPGHFLDDSHLDGTGGATNRFYTTIAFVQTGTFSESARAYDLNVDGDRDDSFAVGHLAKSWPAGTCNETGATHNGTSAPARTLAFTPDIIVVGDGDGDGASDPIFTLTGTTLTVDLYAARTEEAEPLLRHLRTRVNLRNTE